MQFFSSAVTTLQTLVVALGAGLAVWGVINLLEGYGSDNPGAKPQGIKQLMAKKCIYYDLCSRIIGVNKQTTIVFQLSSVFVYRFAHL